MTESLKHKKLHQSLLKLIIENIFLPEYLETQHVGIQIIGYIEYQ